jgi:hypothetical protein
LSQRANPRTRFPEVSTQGPRKFLFLFLAGSSQEPLLKGFAIRPGKFSAHVSVPQIVLDREKLLKQSVISKVSTFQFGLLLFGELSKQVLRHPFFLVGAHDCIPALHFKVTKQLIRFLPFVGASCILRRSLAVARGSDGPGFLAHSAECRVARPDFDVLQFGPVRPPGSTAQ